jgi:hypothetical protein
MIATDQPLLPLSQARVQDETRADMDRPVGLVA